MFMNSICEKKKKMKAQLLCTFNDNAVTLIKNKSTKHCLIYYFSNNFNRFKRLSEYYFSLIFSFANARHAYCLGALIQRHCIFM